MKWAHLPNAGGLYDQHPGLLDDFYFIMTVETKAEHARMADEEAKRNRLHGRGQGGGAGGRRSPKRGGRR